MYVYCGLEFRAIARCFMSYKQGLEKRQPLFCFWAVKFAQQTWRELRSNSQSASYVFHEARASCVRI